MEAVFLELCISKGALAFSSTLYEELLNVAGYLHGFYARTLICSVS